MNTFLEELDHELTSHADATKSREMSKYMRDQFPFYGIQSAVRKDILHILLEKTGLPPKNMVKEIVFACWEKQEREYQMIAMSLAKKYLRQTEKKDIDMYVFMITHKSWWDTVDFIAATLVGNYFRVFPSTRNAKINEWISSGNLWLQRTTLLFQLKYKDQTDEYMLEQNIMALNTGKEFFIHKAIGWALREYSKTNPEWVADFVKRNTLSSLSRKEALKWLNKKK